MPDASSISMLPVLGQRIAAAHAPASADAPPVHYALDEGNTLYLTSGRTAIGLGLERLGTGTGDEVLVPAYHCPSMIEPLHWLGAVPVYYRLDRHFAPDLDHLASMITARTRAVLAAHLFAKPIDMTPLATLCEERGITLIEDCAHTLYHRSGEVAPGSIGTFAIASLRKFFPVRDGGALISPDTRLTHGRLPHPPIAYETKMAYNTLEDSTRHGVAGPLGAVVHLTERLRGARRRPPPAQPRATTNDAAMAARGARPEHEAHSPVAGDSAAPSPPAADPRFSPSSRQMSMSGFSRAVLASVRHRTLAAARRRNFAHLAARLADSPLGRPLWSAAQAPTVPYVFPFLLHRPERHHPALIAAGLPVWRWDELLAPGVCAQADAWRYALIQLPCHQGLAPAQLDRLVDTMHQVAQ
jgi:perosamine synthetase